MTADWIGFSLLMLAILLYAGKWVRMHWRPAQQLFLPASILAGAIGLLLGPGVLGAIMRTVGGEEAPLAQGAIPASMLDVWSDLPGLLINVVFATLLLGVPLPKWKRVWGLAGPQLAFGVTLGAGQYVIGILIAAFILAPFFGLPLMAGALIEIGFEGGHGTAAGLQETFAELGFADGADLAVGMATVGVISGIVFGIILINWGVRTGKSAVLDKAVDSIPHHQRRGLVSEDERPLSAGGMTVRSESIEPLTLHFAFIAMAILIGLGFLEAMAWVESVTWGAGENGVELLGAVPLFPLAMIGGLVVQQLLTRFDTHNLLDRDLMVRIQGFALDLLIAAAIASLSLKVIADNLVPFLLLGLAGIAWNVGMFLWLAPRIIPKYWFERGIGDIGQSMGVTATGLILMKIADPDNKTPAYEAFGYKQMVFEPFFGGGLVTGLALPVIYNFGAWPLFGVMLALVAIGIGSGLFYFAKLEQEP
ncbi:sodium/glutamate symporter [Salinisphaera orenii]|uniref:Sodium:glutamate symporter n=1 Tax=Salinisphaera orenii YIM 95161 TaxID=1051139 RepID=A0A423Q0S9_9GAMM|nr:sodium:glutamate symporter [Salinisphaera halophila]ROO31858.1 sodium:glutamate symporter [Salinisphaera halophila YIM 95161]